MAKTHPCQGCGACCAFFRVSFYWREAERPSSAPWTVPPALTEDLSDSLRVMKGTREGKRIRCAALEGKLGERVGCSIYPDRPSPCRDFQASYENGAKNPRCDQARAAYGLPPLRRADWAPVPAPPPPSGITSSAEASRPPSPQS